MKPIYILLGLATFLCGVKGELVIGSILVTLVSYMVWIDSSPRKSP